MANRNILGKLHAAIIALTALHADAAQLDLRDNDQASRRLKRDFTAFKGGPMADLSKAITETRSEINARPKRKISSN